MLSVKYELHVSMRRTHMQAVSNFDAAVVSVSMARISVSDRLIAFRFERPS